ncbi:hypothetical protein Tco_0115833 [Tanacetum coccineum]
MRILSVVSVKVFEKYGYNYLREIILRRADYQEYKISEKDFKNLHPNDFEDLFLLNIQEKLNHLPKTDKIDLHTAELTHVDKNLVIMNRGGTCNSDEAINKKAMRLNELHKFSDGTLTRVHGKAWTQMVKGLYLFSSTIRAWRTGSGQGDDKKKKQRLHQCYRRKVTTDQKDLSKI